MMIKFEDIQRANREIVTLNVKGKEYAEVNQRIKAFRLLFPMGRIDTEMLSNDGKVCVFQAKIYDEEGNMLGSGTAFEDKDASYINKTSYIENCETSAVGRALGMCGFGIDTSVASYEEVSHAIEQQEGQKTIGKTKAKALESRMKKLNAPIDVTLKQYGVNSLEELTEKDLSDINMVLNAMAAKDNTGVDFAPVTEEPLATENQKKNVIWMVSKGYCTYDGDIDKLTMAQAEAFIQAYKERK